MGSEVEITPAVETFGHIPFRRRADRFCAWLSARDDRANAYKVQDLMWQLFKARGVAKRFLQEMASTRDTYRPGASDEEMEDEA
jgi:hypothetical protein